MLDEAFNDDDDDDEAEKARALVAARGRAIIGLGISISVDELIVGFTIGYSQYFTTLGAITAIVVQSFLALMAANTSAGRSDGRSASAWNASPPAPTHSGRHRFHLRPSSWSVPRSLRRRPALHPLLLPPQGHPLAGASAVTIKLPGAGG